MAVAVPLDYFSAFSEFPAQIGYDAAGIVESTGPEVKTLKVGDRNTNGQSRRSKLFWAKIDRVFDGLDEYAAAHRYLETNDQIGKITVALSN